MQLDAASSGGLQLSAQEQIQAHIKARVDAEYPDAEFGGADGGGGGPHILEMLEADGQETRCESAST